MRASACGYTYNTVFMKSRILPLLAVLLVAASCSPKITRNLVASNAPLSPDTEVKILDAGTDTPEGAILLGSVKIGDTGFTSTDNGTYYKVTELLKSETRANGGNLAIITKHKSPDVASTIHRIWADIYYLEDMSVLAVMDSLDRAATVHPDYAVIYLYRPEALAGFAISYNVSVNDTKVYHCSNNSSAEVKIYEPGEYTVWAKTESRSEVPLKVELGEEYYIECSVGMGAFVGRPVLRLIDSRYARSAYKSTKKK